MAPIKEITKPFGFVSVQRGSTVVRTIVQPKPLSAYLVETPAVEVDAAVPVLHLPGTDESDRASLTGSIQLEAGASAMLQVGILQ